jgi:hypothetical protein
MLPNLYRVIFKNAVLPVLFSTAFSSLDLFDVSLREMFLPNRIVDDNIIEVLETDIPVTPPTKRCRKKDRKNSIFEYYSI